MPSEPSNTGPSSEASPQKATVTGTTPLDTQGHDSSTNNSTSQRGMFDTSRVNAITGGQFSQTTTNFRNTGLTVNVHQYTPGSNTINIKTPADVQNQMPQGGKKTRKRTRVRKNNDIDVRANTIYERHLLAKKRGYPLWIPECSLTLPIEKQREGIVIGDVGLITSSGGFSFLFNITLPANHTFQPSRMPDGYDPAPSPKPRDVLIFNELKPRSSLTSISVDELNNQNKIETGEHVFQSSSAEGAILALPDGATTIDLEGCGLWRRYMAKHIESWYRYVNGVLGREAKNGDIRLIVGCDKASRWGMAAVSRQVHSHSPHQLRYRPALRHDQKVQLEHVWDCTGVVETRSGPTANELRKLGVDFESESEVPNNQCVFIRTMNGMLSEKAWTRVNKEIGDSALSHEDSDSPYSDATHSLDQTPSSTDTTSQALHAPRSPPSPNISSSLNYLDDIKLRFRNDSTVHRQFLNILEDFNAESYRKDTLSVIERMSKFFLSNPGFLEGFNTFLPPGYKMGIPADPLASLQRTTITTPLGIFHLNTQPDELTPILNVDLALSSGTTEGNRFYTNSHPGDDLNRYLLQLSPLSRAVITTDDDWTWPSLLTTSASSELPYRKEILGSTLLSRRVRVYSDVIMLDHHCIPEFEKTKATPAHQLAMLHEEVRNHGSSLTNSSPETVHLYLLPMLDALKSLHHNLAHGNPVTYDPRPEEIYSTSVVQNYLQSLDEWMLRSGQAQIGLEIHKPSAEAEENGDAAFFSMRSLLRQKTTLSIPASIDTKATAALIHHCMRQVGFPFKAAVESYLHYRVFGSFASLEQCFDALKQIVDLDISQEFPRSWRNPTFSLNFVSCNNTRKRRKMDYPEESTRNLSIQGDIKMENEDGDLEDDTRMDDTRLSVIRGLSDQWI